MKIFRKFDLIILLSVFLTTCSKTKNDTSETLSDIEGNIYKTVNIGSQTWMAENLISTTYADGTPLTNGDGLGSISENSSEKYYFNYPKNPDLQLDFGSFYSHLRENGKLYTWAAANRADETEIDRQGVCPYGWHIPSKNEWDELFNYVGIDSAAISLKNDDQYFWNCPGDQQFKDEYGFKVLPSGGRDGLGAFYIFDVYAYFWTSSKANDNHVWASLFTCTDDVKWYTSGKANAFPIRCIRD
jgi:uncharacterized protein (TIGR02145 family)